MQINVPVLPGNRYALDDADRLLCFGGCDRTELRETTAMLSKTKETLWLSVTT